VNVPSPLPDDQVDLEACGILMPYHFPEIGPDDSPCIRQGFLHIYHVSQTRDGEYVKWKIECAEDADWLNGTSEHGCTQECCDDIVYEPATPTEAQRIIEFGPEW